MMNSRSQSGALIFVFVLQAVRGGGEMVELSFPGRNGTESALTIKMRPNQILSIHNLAYIGL